MTKNKYNFKTGKNYEIFRVHILALDFSIIADSFLKYQKFNLATFALKMTNFFENLKSNSKSVNCVEECCRLNSK